MDELTFVYATGAVIVAYFVAQVVTRRFDPFAPTWLFLVGYLQVYVVQPVSAHEYAVSARGVPLVAAASWRAFWALIWFLGVYHLGPGRLIAPALPRAPTGWSTRWVLLLSPPLILWGLYCAGVVIRQPTDDTLQSAEETLLRSFPFLMMVASVMLIVTGRTLSAPRPAYLAAGLAFAALYVLIWMFNGKRSHSLMAVLSTICALYVARLKRPSWPVLFATALAGVLVVSIAIGWRNDRSHDRSLGGFVSFLADFNPSTILESLNVTGDNEEEVAYETWEYGGYLLMLDTVPAKSDYDYGANYLRVFSTFIPRLLWPDKPIYGRHAWISAWIAGSELEREEDFASPAIGILGATQLNGGALATFIVVGVLGLALRTAYEYFRIYAHTPWAQFAWSIGFFNSWFMVVGDDPMVWFYYNWGFTACPIVVLTWLVNSRTAKRANRPDAAPREVPGHDPSPLAEAPALATC